MGNAFDNNGSNAQCPYDNVWQPAIKTISNDYVIFVNGNQFLPVAALHNPDSFPTISSYSVDGYKRNNSIFWPLQAFLYRR